VNPQSKGFGGLGASRAIEYRNFQSLASIKKSPVALRKNRLDKGNERSTTDLSGEEEYLIRYENRATFIQILDKY
jgi:hypothetical protein